MKEILYRLAAHELLSRDEACEVLLNVADGKYNDCQLSAFMMAYQMRSITSEELAGFRDAILKRRNPVKVDASDAIDIVGTGGDGKNTFNISTAACFVVAGAGYRVVKHGNYSATSVSGASTVLSGLGAVFQQDSDKLQRSLDEAGISYFHAPFFSPALKSVANARRLIGVRSFFNLLGPLVNPVKPDYQLLGVYNLPMLRLYNYVAQEGGKHCSCVTSFDGYDEISLTSPFKIANEYGEKIFTPESLSLPTYKQSELSGGNTPDEARTIFLNVLGNTATEAQTNVVLANATFAILTLRPNLSVATAFSQAKESLQSGKAQCALKKFLEINA